MEQWEVPDWCDESPRLAYLYFIRDTVFGSRPELQVVKCRKYPEFGKINREDIGDVIGRLEDCTSCDAEGCMFCIPGYHPDRIYSTDPALDLVGKRVIASIDPGYKANGLSTYLVDDYATQASQYVRDAVKDKKQFFAELYGGPPTRDWVDELQNCWVDNPTEDLAEYNAHRRVEATHRMMVAMEELHGTGINVEYNRINYQEDRMEVDAEFFRRQAAKMLKNAEILDSVPDSDVFEDGQIIRFEKVFPGQKTVYKWASIKANDAWYTTGGKSLQGVDWSTLVSFIGLANIPSIRVITDSKGVSLREFKDGIEKALEDKDAADEGSK